MQEDATRTAALLRPLPFSRATQLMCLLIGAGAKPSLCRCDQSVAGNTVASYSEALGVDVSLPQRASAKDRQPKDVDELARIQPGWRADSRTTSAAEAKLRHTRAGWNRRLVRSAECRRRRPSLRLAAALRAHGGGRGHKHMEDYGRSRPAQPVSPPSGGAASQSLQQRSTLKRS